ncbi:MAG: sugar ABC transporter permease [Lachnospiraceae bacterium]|jgi:putative aldouronate transport system permease protein|nr:sugar ABC transporter permease [Lachnospiraceae bacterium]MCI8995300.1 sugar ABC transporter permease [Lachnospiraceae bacterium]MCI9133384.1 sugar ABC transporter permease [Lachnospiraceae bacterium]
MRQAVAETAPMPGSSRKKLWNKIKRQKWLLLMMTPAFLCILLFNYLPLSGWYIAFSEYKLGGSLFGGEFVGLKYFAKIFQESSDLVYLIRNTLVMNGVTLILNLLVALILAILLKEATWKRGAKITQTVSFFPYFVSWVIGYSIVWSLLAVNSGAINQFLVRVGILEKGLNILGDPKYSWQLIILLNMWKSTGYNTIIFLSAISGISSEEYEAAALDGAGRWQQIRYVTLPNLLPTVSVLLIMNAGWILSSNLEQFFIFSNPTNWSRMEVLDMYIYKFGLKMLDFPYATAMGIIKTIVSIMLLLFVNWLTKRMNENSVL